MFEIIQHYWQASKPEIDIFTQFSWSLQCLCLRGRLKSTWRVNRSCSVSPPFACPLVVKTLSDEMMTEVSLRLCYLFEAIVK